MRISDWSSDVCSSDLGGSPRDRIVQTTARQLYRIALRRADAVFMQNPDDADEFVGRRIVPREKIFRVNGSGVDPAAWPLMDLPDPPVPFALAARLLWEKGRSEEHTSELQSLMRIYYAVFCLK